MLLPSHILFPSAHNNHKRLFLWVPLSLLTSLRQVRLREVILLKVSLVNYIEKIRVTLKTVHYMIILVPLCGGDIWMLKAEETMYNPKMWLSEWRNMQPFHQVDQQDNCPGTSHIMLQSEIPLNVSLLQCVDPFSLSKQECYKKHSVLNQETRS